jgi:hypothetical protein
MKMNALVTVDYAMSA